MMSPEEEAAMLQARQDLGDQRMTDLPLSGKIVKQYQKFDQNLTGISDTVKAWHGIYLPKPIVIRRLK